MKNSAVLRFSLVKVLSGPNISASQHLLLEPKLVSKEVTDCFFKLIFTVAANSV